MSPDSNFIPHESIVNILNINTYYWEYGNPAAQETLILIHGFRGDHHGLELIATKLIEFRVVVPDLPGFGLSECLEENSLDNYIQWLEEFTLSLKIKGNIVLLGHSFGTIIVAAAVAKGLPVEQVIMVNPIAQPLSRWSPIAQLTVFYYYLAAALPKTLAQKLLQSKLIVKIMTTAMIKTKNTKTRNWIHEQHQQYFTNIASQKTIFATFQMIRMNSISQWAHKVVRPCLLIVAEKDNISSIDQQKKLASLFNNATLDVISQYGHLLHYEAPATVASKIINFVKGVIYNA